MGLPSTLAKLEIFAGPGVLEGNLQGVPEAFHLETATVG